MFVSALRRSRLPLLAMGAALTAALVLGTQVRAPHTLAAAPDATPGIVVSGEGVISAPPDTVTLQLGVQVQAADVATARQQAAQAASAVFAAVKADGVADQDAQTVQFSINPVYDNSNNQQTLRGYQVQNLLQVKIRNLDSAGQVIDDAVNAGGNAAVVRGVSFSIENSDALLHQARLLAMQNAQAKAQDYASAAGVTLGRVIEVQEQSANLPTPVALKSAAPGASAAYAPTPIQAGDQQVRVEISVTFAIQ